MRHETEKNRQIATHCKSCGRLLMNPGYGKMNVYCCGKYRKWFDNIKITEIYDDGRDEKGRFHHAPQMISCREEKIFEGGE